jgi:hypothetical protein
MTGAKFRPSTRQSPRDLALVAADQRLVAARDQMSRAALACLRQTPDATAQVRLALGLVEQARNTLAGLAERED